MNKKDTQVYQRMRIQQSMASQKRNQIKRNIGLDMRNQLKGIKDMLEVSKNESINRINTVGVVIWCSEPMKLDLDEEKIQNAARMQQKPKMYLQKLKVVDEHFNYTQPVNDERFLSAQFCNVYLYFETKSDCIRLKKIGDLIYLKRFQI